MTDKPLKTITFLPVNITLQVKKDQSLLDFALENKINIDHSCGGMGTCGTCVVKVVKGNEILSNLNELEIELHQSRNLPQDERQSCQIQALGGLIIELKKHRS